MRLYLTSRRRIWRAAHEHFRTGMAHRQEMRRLVVERVIALGAAGLPQDPRDFRWVIESVGKEWYRRLGGTPVPCCCEAAPHDACL